MTPFDDNDLIDRLQSAIAEHQSGITAPDGIGDAARRAARRRTAKRAVGAGVPVLAAAGVATVLAISPGSGSTTPSGPSAGPVKVQDTAYIIKRVKARIADDSPDGTVIHSYTYVSGEVSSDGSLVNLGQKTLDGYGYTAPDGSVSFRNDFHGNPDEITVNDLVPDGNGNYDDNRTIIDPRSRTYSQDHFSGLSNPNATAGLNLFSRSSEVQRALQNGRVTQNGMATVNGTQAIVLSVQVPSGSARIGSAPGARIVSTNLILYVDAQTYQPLRRVLSFGGASGLLVADWVPATPENIARATDNSIPAGYTKVDDTH